jgi:hypothetical protein
VPEVSVPLLVAEVQINPTIAPTEASFFLHDGMPANMAIDNRIMIKPLFFMR